MYKWSENLVADSLDCQTNKQKQRNIHEAPVEKWNDTVSPIPVSYGPQ